MVLTISYFATGSESMPQLDAGAVLGAAVAELDLGAHGGEQLALGLDVADLGDVFEDDLVFGEDGGGHAGKGGVFGSGDFDGSEKRITAANNELIHEFGDSCLCPLSVRMTTPASNASARNEQKL